MNIKNALVYIALAFIYVMSFFPLRWLHYCGRFIGYSLWRLHARSAKIAKINLTYCFPKKSPQIIDDLCRRSLMVYGETLLEIPMAWHWSKKRVNNRIIDIQGIDYLLEASKTKQGILLIVPHYGNWEILNHFLNQHVNLTAMYKPAKIKALDQYILKKRLRITHQLVPTNRKGVNLIFRAVKSGQCIAILPDQEPIEKNGGVYAPFFKKTTLTSILACQIAKKTQAHLLCCYAKRLKNGCYSIVIRPANPMIRDHDPLKAATALNQTIEHCIMDDPEHYLWIYKRFTWLPEGKNTLYQTL
jgi:KDO2-lipid IV(A) lauroyltransferase